MSNSIRVGGVTEHFNLPWNLAVEQNLFSAVGINLQWKFFPGGTGVMTEALQNGELDLAILLTEGFISAAGKGLKAKIVKEYISSPLGWGIFTGAQSTLYSVYSNMPKKYAISKLGSGSHLMAMIHAEQRGESIQPDELIEVKSLQGAMESLAKNETHIFYWEKFTTKPFVLNGTVRMIDEFSAPWSSFLIVASETAFDNKRDTIQKILDIMNNESTDFVLSKHTVGLLEERFSMSKEDAETWLRATVWNNGYTIRLSGLENARNALAKIGGVEENLSVKDFCAPGLTLI